MSSLELGIVSDEISLDFREALNLGLEWGITLYELRCLKTGRLPAVDPAELQDVENLVKERGVTITALSPGIFKHPVSQTKELEHELAETLPRSFDLAHRLGASLLLVFGFKQDPGGREGQVGRAVEIMSRAAEQAADAGIRIAIENEPGFVCDSGTNTASFIEQVGSPLVGANWDPCNGYGTPERPYPEGYEALKKHIFNVHVKDTKAGSLIQCVPVGDGNIDWKGQMGALLRDGIVGHVSIETHCLPLIENSRRNVEILRQYLGELAASTGKSQ